MRGITVAIAFFATACTSGAARLFPPPTPELATAHLQPLANAAQRIDALAEDDPAYAGSHLDEASRRVVVSFTGNAKSALVRYSRDRIYRPRHVRYSMSELRQAEAVATQKVREKAINFRILGLDIQRNRVLIEGLDRRQSILVRANLEKIRGVELFFDDSKQTQGEVQ